MAARRAQIVTPDPRDVAGMAEGLSAFRAVRNPCRLVDEKAAPRAKNGRWSDAAAGLPFRTYEGR